MDCRRGTLTRMATESTTSAASAHDSARMNIGEVLELLRQDFPSISIPKIAGGAGPLTVLVNGIPLAEAGSVRRTLFFAPEGPGFVRLTVMDGDGKTDSVVVRLQ